MIAILKSDCFLVSQESDGVGRHNNSFSFIIKYMLKHTLHKSERRYADLTLLSGIVCTQARQLGGGGVDQNPNIVFLLLLINQFCHCLQSLWVISHCACTLKG